MLVSALSLVGYGIGMALVSSGVRSGCEKAATDRAVKRISKLPANHTEADEDKICRSEHVKAVMNYSAVTALVGVAGAAGVAELINTFDPIEFPGSKPAIETKPSSPQVTDDATTVTFEDGTTVATF